MPLHKVPVKLYDLASRILNDLIEVTCCNIWHAYGSYSNPAARQAITNVQDFLTTCIPVSVLDHVFNLKKKGKFCIPICCIYNGDIKLLFALLMHQSMRIFKIVNLDIPYSLTSKIEESFWISCLSKMSNLIFLDLSLVCTDAILEVIGKCCVLLEEVTIIAKMSKAPRGGNFNALRKIYHVSDKGLSYLVQCQKLKCITLNAKNRSGHGNITEKGISLLICSLPNLKFINYEFMGLVLTTLPASCPPLPLKYLKDIHTSPTHVINYTKFCPLVTHLYISLPTNLSQKECEILSSVIEEILTKSSFELQLLNQSFMHLTNNMLSLFLESKGFNLICIEFGLGCNNFDLTTLILIGHYCPNLEKLAINTMGADVSGAAHKITSKEAMYTKLHTLRLNGTSDWCVEQALSLCLQGYRVTELYLYGSHVCLDHIFHKLLLSKHLNELKYLMLRRQCYISKNMISQILQFCPKLRELGCLFRHTFTPDDMLYFESYITNNNFDIKIDI